MTGTDFVIDGGWLLEESEVSLQAEDLPADSQNSRAMLDVTGSFGPCERDTDTSTDA